MRYALFLGLLLVAGCVFPTDPTVPFDVELELDRTFVWAPTGFTVTVRAINQSRFTATLPTEEFPCTLAMEIANPQGEVISDSCYGRGRQGIVIVPSGDRDTVVPPGDTLIQTFSVSGFLRWQPGIYQVTGMLRAGDDERRTAPQEFILQCREPGWPRC